ncbi:hypothetical protein DFJ77DRAFT_450913 [Powellomyces hirtus]|nr:hypothetical protein DFJ77DRAFT_450913 [Powellomyces hirtus]
MNLDNREKNSALAPPHSGKLDAGFSWSLSPDVERWATGAIDHLLCTEHNYVSPKVSTIPVLSRFAWRLGRTVVASSQRPAPFQVWSPASISNAFESRDMIIKYCQEKEFKGLWIVTDRHSEDRGGNAQETGNVTLSQETNGIEASASKAGIKFLATPALNSKRPLQNLLCEQPSDLDTEELANWRALGDINRTVEYVAAVWSQKTDTTPPQQKGLGLDRTAGGAQLIAWLVAALNLEKCDERWCVQFAQQSRQSRTTRANAWQAITFT